MNSEKNATSLVTDDTLYKRARRETRRRMRQIRTGAARHLGPFERVTLSVAGRLDGVRSQPREDADGNWSSPLIRKELDAFEEYCDRVWGTEMVHLEPYHIRIGQLVTDIARLERKLRQLGDGDAAPEDAYLTMRKRGEELLSEAQVRARRQREFDRMANAVRARADAIENTLTEHYLELAKLHSIVTDAESEARLSCERVENHTKQRIDTYWRSALGTHPEQARMPAFPLSLPGTDAERTYFELHSGNNAAARELLERFQETKTIMEVA